MRCLDNWVWIFNDVLKTTLTQLVHHKGGETNMNNCIECSHKINNFTAALSDCFHSEKPHNTENIWEREKEVMVVHAFLTKKSAINKRKNVLFFCIACCIPPHLLLWSHSKWAIILDGETGFAQEKKITFQNRGSNRTDYIRSATVVEKVWCVDLAKFRQQ